MNITVTKHKSFVKIPWRLRLKIWWNVRKLPRELREALDRSLDEAMLFGSAPFHTPTCGRYDDHIAPDQCAVGLMIFRYPKLRVSRIGISFQWWHGWFNHGWHSWPVNYWGIWLRSPSGKWRLKTFKRWQ